MARPRIYPAGSDRLARSRQALSSAGGKRMDMCLSAADVAALQLIQSREGLTTARAAISAALAAYAGADRADDASQFESG